MTANCRGEGSLLSTPCFHQDEGLGESSSGSYKEQVVTLVAPLLGVV